MFQGQSLRVTSLGESGVFELCFDRQGEAINKFDKRTVAELREATTLLRQNTRVKGVLVTSAKEVFIVGADIAEFGAMFKMTAAEIAADVSRSNEVFVDFEDLSVPSVVAINGFALGGGLEFALTCCYRVMSHGAQVGVPEVSLGLFPGFGGTVRLMRIAGPAVASEWVAGGKPVRADRALAAGVVDEAVDGTELRTRALSLLSRAMAGQLDWTSRQRVKRGSVTLPTTEVDAIIRSVQGKSSEVSPPNQPAAAMALSMMLASAKVDRGEALAQEARMFGEVARTQAAASLVRAFLNEQAVKKEAKRFARLAPPVRRGAVLGAGIMGGGIAFSSAVKGVPVRLNDVRAEALAQGMSEVAKQLARQVKSGRLSEERSADVTASITPQLDDTGFSDVDIVVEAIVENLVIKRVVLSALELSIPDGTVIASNTSSLRIADIAASLKRPSRLVGMHFFNPVPMMPLVEIVRADQTNDATVATAVGYAMTMGKTPIVVKDCPGFLVNRVFTAYVRAFLKLIEDGADFLKVDEAMESFGWPMGPAYLEDVIGIDTGSHVNDVISAGYPQRMPPLEQDALRLMARLGRHGQKTGLGFYRYEMNPRGKPIRSPAQDTHELLSSLQKNGLREFTSDEIIDRMMLPMIVESAHALEAKVVATPAELDMALHLGLGFPAYAGGPLQYADWLGLSTVTSRCDRLRALGPAYEPTPAMRMLAASGGTFHGGPPLGTG